LCIGDLAQSPIPNPQSPWKFYLMLINLNKNLYNNYKYNINIIIKKNFLII